MSIASYTPMLKQLMLSGIMASPAVSRLPRINATGIFFLWLAAVLVVLGLGFGMYAGYAYLATIYVAHAAAAMVMGLAVLAAIISGTVSMLFMNRRARRAVHAMGPQPDIAKTVTALIDSIAEELEEPIRENPKTAIMIASLAGFLAGDSSRH